MCGMSGTTATEEEPQGERAPRGAFGLETPHAKALAEAAQAAAERRQTLLSRLPQPGLADPLTRFLGEAQLLRANPDAVRGIGDAPGVRRRRFRARTLGITQLGVPLPGPLQGGLDLPDFD